MMKHKRSTHLFSTMVLAFVLFLLFGFFPSGVRGQGAGEFSCQWDFSENVCLTDFDGCGVGYMSYCSRFNTSEPASLRLVQCNNSGNTRTCIQDPDYEPPPPSEDDDDTDPGGFECPLGCTTSSDCSDPDLPYCVNSTGGVCTGNCEAYTDSFAPGPGSDTASLVGCNNEPGTVDTAIGCIPFQLVSNLARFFLQWSISIGGGVSLLLIGLSGIMLATSSGNPDKVKSARSLFMAAVGGLLFLLLSIFLLRFIGFSVLGLFA